MAFRLHCDRCLRFLQVVDAKKMKEMAENNQEMICTACQKSEEKLNRVIENMKGQIADRLRVVEKEFKDQLATELRAIIDENKEIKE